MDIKLLLRPLIMRQHQFSVQFPIIIIDHGRPDQSDKYFLQSVQVQIQFLTDSDLSFSPLRSTAEGIIQNPEAIRWSEEQALNDLMDKQKIYRP